uniref:Ubiquitin-like domain-containing protein n=1 Tax=Entomoneis paludosa TaxID=265537 RepID=A0A7S3DN91_9STRA|mmetsp:Transcript_22870/g.47714  ORF Transcript_22870/g.47714 Transcript_22870/m.47714 type:complete len:361 (+) Transcript_22870:114-1196(+)
MSSSAAAMSESGLWLPGATGATTKEDKIEKWWEVNRKHDPPLTRGATPLVERCMRVLGWKQGFAERTLKGYRQFMELKSVMNDWQATKLTAPFAIQQMWEQHLLDNLNYTDDCFLLFGRVIGHDPDSQLNERATIDRVKTTKIAFQARYGADLDPDVWEFGAADSDSSNMTGAGAIDVEDHHMGIHQSGSHGGIGGGFASRGRLPVAASAIMAANALQHQQGQTPATDREMSMSPRGRSLVSSSDDENAPIVSRPASPTRQATRQPTSTSKASPRTPKSPSGNDPITIFLRDTNSGEETYFSLRYRSTLRIVFTVFAERKGLTQENLKFSFNGQSLTGYETPYSLGLEDRARIDVQIGQR